MLKKGKRVRMDPSTVQTNLEKLTAAVVLLYLRFCYI